MNYTRGNNTQAKQTQTHLDVDKILKEKTEFN